MPFFSVLLLLCAAWVAWKASLFARSTARRWRGGLFRPALLTGTMGFLCLLGSALLVFGAYSGYQIDQSYRRAGAADVEYLGYRPGFPNPLVAYTDRETERTCMAEVVGGEEYLNELVCLNPQEKAD